MNTEVLNRAFSLILSDNSDCAEDTGTDSGGEGVRAIDLCAGESDEPGFKSLLLGDMRDHYEHLYGMSGCLSSSDASLLEELSGEYIRGIAATALDANAEEAEHIAGEALAGMKIYPRGAEFGRAIRQLAGCVEKLERLIDSEGAEDWESSRGAERFLRCYGKVKVRVGREGLGLYVCPDAQVLGSLLAGLSAECMPKGLQLQL